MPMLMMALRLKVERVDAPRSSYYPSHPHRRENPCSTMRICRHCRSTSAPHSSSPHSESPSGKYSLNPPHQCEATGRPSALAVHGGVIRPSGTGPPSILRTSTRAPLQHVPKLPHPRPPLRTPPLVRRRLPRLPRRNHTRIALLLRIDGPLPPLHLRSSPLSPHPNRSPPGCAPHTPAYPSEPLAPFTTLATAGFASSHLCPRVPSETVPSPPLLMLAVHGLGRSAWRRWG